MGKQPQPGFPKQQPHQSRNENHEQVFGAHKLLETDPRQTAELLVSHLAGVPSRRIDNQRGTLAQRDRAGPGLFSERL